MRSKRDYSKEHIKNKYDAKLRICTYAIISSFALNIINLLIVFLHSKYSLLLGIAFVYLMLIPLTLADKRQGNRGLAAAIANACASVFWVVFCGEVFSFSAIYPIFISEALACIIVGLIVFKHR